MSSDSAHPKPLLQSCGISKTLKIVVECISGDLSELYRYFLYLAHPFSVIPL
jgi:hypothetical protein